jgi:hypothetical protein
MPYGLFREEKLRRVDIACRGCEVATLPLCEKKGAEARTKEGTA